MNILIVEDEVLLAMELESEVEGAGHRVVGMATDSREAIELIDSASPQFAFVDIQLLDGATGIDVGRYLSANGIAFVFVSGNLKRIPEDFAGAIGAIEKPYTMNGLQNALQFLQAIVDGARGPLIAPPSLVLSPVVRATLAA
ncbi:response regulator [Rhizobium sp. S163]|uniref:response regulator n=1 Tax=Rhizobium sp. S163 TaxID=3055039 RepID=UPI0025A95A84|nr:response regulator [Rhizobium sp. S163]MDM9646827.1 response regulator [Rhizobium sp. S163]